MRTALLILFVFGAMCFACSTEPDLTTGQYQPKLVVDGWIEENGYPRVILGRSASYFSPLDSSTIRSLVITTAKVTVSDGENSEILTLTRDNTYFPPFVYTGTQMKGVTGKTYTLTIEHQGKTYSSATTIPPAAEMEELWFDLADGEDSLGYLYGRFTDNSSEENFYRIFTQRENIDKRYVPIYLSAIADRSFNGQSFTFSILRGPDTFNEVVDDLYFTLGDTVRIKFCTMDKAHFDFWRTLERELYVVGNPFSSAGNEILSNIQGENVLGVWGGYGVRYYRFIAR